MLRMAGKSMVRVHGDQEIGLKPLNNTTQPALGITFPCPKGAQHSALILLMCSLRGEIREIGYLQAGLVSLRHRLHLASAHGSQIGLASPKQSAPSPTTPGEDCDMTGISFVDTGIGKQRTGKRLVIRMGTDHEDLSA